MANERKTAQGLGRVGPEPPSLEARVDWVANPPPAYLELRRAELVHTRRISRLKIAALGTLVAGALSLIGVAIAVGGPNAGLGLLALFAGWGVRWLIPHVHAARENTRQIESLDRRPALPAARVVIREPKTTPKTTTRPLADGLVK